MLGILRKCSSISSDSLFVVRESMNDDQLLVFFSCADRLILKINKNNDKMFLSFMCLNFLQRYNKKLRMRAE